MRLGMRNLNAKRSEKMPTEMFFHFFKSFSDKANCNLNIQSGRYENEHHKIEAIFKAFAKADKNGCANVILKIRQFTLDKRQVL